MQNIEQSKFSGETELPPIEFTNLIQAELIGNSHEDPMEWVAKNSENFRKLLVANPSLIEEYKKVLADKEKKARFLKFVAGALVDVRVGEGNIN